MIFVDTNIFVIDIRYQRDSLFAVNRRFIDRLGEIGRGVTGLVNVLETCGILSFNLPPHLLNDLFRFFGDRYRVLILPAAADDSMLPAHRAGDLLHKMEKRLSLKDAEVALTVDRIPNVESFVSWNSKHFRGKVRCPVFTPRQWLNRSF